MEFSTTALQGIKVLDFTEYGAGPFCSMLLGDLGADVIKIEPPRGDGLRAWGPQIDGISTPFVQLNRNKRSMVLDLKVPEQQEQVRKLVRHADVLIENFRPGTMERFGLSYPQLSAINEQLIYCSISGYGQKGPYKGRGGFDLILQGHGGLMGVSGEPNRPPIKAGLPVIDFAAAAHAAIGILAAYISRTHTRRGQWVDISLLDVPVSWLALVAAKYWATGEVQEPLGSAHPLSAPYQAFRTQDGYMTIAAGNQQLWLKTCEVLELKHLVEDERFLTNNDRARNQAQLVEYLESVLATNTTQHWVESLNDVGVPSGPINSVDQVLVDPQVLYRDMVVTAEHPDLGAIKMIGSPIKLSATPASIRRPAPALGQHTTEILAEIA